MKKSKFVYVTYIRTTPKKLWQALTDPEFIRRYFYETTHESDWKPGSSWKMVTPGGKVIDAGEVHGVQAAAEAGAEVAQGIDPGDACRGFFADDI